MDRLGGYFGTHDEEELFDDYVDEGDADLDPPPSPVGQDERRMQVRAYNHWASLLGDLNYPNIDDLEPEKLDDFGPYSVLLGMVDGIEDPDVLFVGSELVEECGEAGAMGKLSDVPSRSVLSRITDHYMQILANQAAIGFEAEFVNERGVTVLYRGILLPYSSDNETIDYIYGVINWKEMADQQTADELLLQIGQALGDFDDDLADEEHHIETAETLTAVDADGWDDDEAESEEDDADVLELGSIAGAADASLSALPEPAFGAAEEVSDAAIKPHRGVDALGNPIGSLRDDEGYELSDEGEDDFDGGLKTAADYGLPDWDDEEDLENEDVDDVVDPLADEDVSSSLTSLVSRGERTKKAVDLSAMDDGPATPQEFVPEPPTITFSLPDPYEVADEIDEDFAASEVVESEAFELSDEISVETSGFDADGEDEDDAYELGFEAIAEDDDSEDEIFELEEVVEDSVEEIAEPVATVDAEVSEEIQDDEPVVVPEESPEGLYDCLAAARELAQAAQNTEDRSRKALYAAVGLAYDFSLETEADPEGFDELLSDNGLTVQDRAPMTPVVKLVFGAEYDKTRLTEYAAVLMHAHRIGVERGALAGFLHEAEGGLKGVVNAERRARKEEQGKPVEDTDGVRSTLAKKLRKIDPVDFDALPQGGPEFALVMVRRTPEGELVVLGEVPEDVPLVERAARKLLG
ncbi:hypothetical protein [Qipengyuania soli]|uniref:PAS domain-containing protein n=1 Tax=Qipengyuania soli TaxID=2782568 RepID=A0A7S8F415_9SPHN|nr:hypothetical protein IRL76_13170 [Qipengyuania soli]